MVPSFAGKSGLSPKVRGELARARVYILVGWNDDDNPSFNSGEEVRVVTRIEMHYTRKIFWDRVIIFKVRTT